MWKFKKYLAFIVSQCTTTVFSVYIRGCNHFNISDPKVNKHLNFSEDLPSCLVAMAPRDPANGIVSRLQVLEDSNLLYLIFSYLDPASVKETALVSRQDIKF